MLTPPTLLDKMKQGIEKIYALSVLLRNAIQLYECAQVWMYLDW